jgi:hypothetical protein
MFSQNSLRSVRFISCFDIKFSIDFLSYLNSIFVCEIQNSISIQDRIWQKFSLVLLTLLHDLCVLREELFVVAVVVMTEDWLHVRGDFFAHIRGNLKLSLRQFLLEDEENSPQLADMLRAFTKLRVSNEGDVEGFAALECLLEVHRLFRRNHRIKRVFNGKSLQAIHELEILLEDVNNADLVFRQVRGVLEDLLVLHELHAEQVLANLEMEHRLIRGNAGDDERVAGSVPLELRDNLETALEIREESLSFLVHQQLRVIVGDHQFRVADDFRCSFDLHWPRDVLLAAQRDEFGKFHGKWILHQLRRFLLGDCLRHSLDRFLEGSFRTIVHV